MVGQKQKLAWSRNLINNWAPQRVYVSDSGKYVVTFDEWDDDGHLPVVIYGARGRLLAVHNLESLGLLADLRHIEMSTLGVQWKDAAVALFGPNEDRFLVRLHWGRIIVLGLPHGELLADARGAEDSARDDPQWRALLQCVEERVRETALRWLQSESAPERKDGALISGQLQLREAIPRLRDLLTDHTWVRIRYGSRPWVREFYVRKQAATALRAMGEVVKGVVFEIQEGE